MMVINHFLSFSPSLVPIPSPSLLVSVDNFILIREVGKYFFFFSFWSVLVNKYESTFKFVFTIQFEEIHLGQSGINFTSTSFEEGVINQGLVPKVPVYCYVDSISMENTFSVGTDTF